MEQSTDSTAIKRKRNDNTELERDFDDERDGREGLKKIMKLSKIPAGRASSVTNSLPDYMSDNKDRAFGNATELHKNSCSENSVTAENKQSENSYTDGVEVLKKEALTETHEQQNDCSLKNNCQQNNYIVLKNVTNIKVPRTNRNSQSNKISLSFGIDTIISDNFGRATTNNVDRSDSRLSTWFGKLPSITHRHSCQTTIDKADKIDSDDTPPTVKPRKKRRTQFSDLQRYYLRMYYEQNRYPDNLRMMEIARTLRLSSNNVKVWFQNRRSRRKNDVTEDDHASEEENIPPPILPPPLMIYSPGTGNLIHPPVHHLPVYNQYRSYMNASIPQLYIPQVFQPLGPLQTSINGFHILPNYQQFVDSDPVNVWNSQHRND